MKRTILAISMLVLLLAISAAAQNLLTNGNFEAGNTGFTTDYTYIPGDGTHHTEIGDYSVINNPATAFTNGYLSYGDHTTGSGLMFFADGAAPSLNVWGENLNLAAGMYSFTGWAADPDPSLGNAATLGLFLNGTQTGGTFSFAQVGQWEEWTVQFNVTSPGNSFVSIRDTNPNDGSFDDFTLDDLSLTQGGGGTTPEPASLALMGSGLLTCLCAGRKKLFPKP